MVFWWLGVYKDVVNEDDSELIKIGFEHLVHKVHEGYLGICDTKRHDEKFVVPVTGAEGSLFNAFRFNF